jgi:hypothetical protein
MTERDIKEKIGVMCGGCVFNKLSGCIVPSISINGQEERVDKGICKDSVTFALETDKFPLIEYSLVSVEVRIDS